jgi:NADH-quinone oxidoreductase subunit E
MNSDLRQLLQKHSHDQPESLIPILQEIQEELGYLTEEAIDMVGKLLKLPSSKIYGLATFYNQFRFQPKGKYHIQVCHGTSCHMFGAESIVEIIQKQLKVKPEQTSRNGKFSLEVIPCMGGCALSPVITVNGKCHSKMTLDNLKDLLNELIEND